MKSICDGFIKYIMYCFFKYLVGFTFFFTVVSLSSSDLVWYEWDDANSFSRQKTGNTDNDGNSSSANPVTDFPVSFTTTPPMRNFTNSATKQSITPTTSKNEITQNNIQDSRIDKMYLNIVDNTTSYFTSPIQTIKNNNGTICLWFQADIMLDVTYKSWKRNKKILRRTSLTFPTNTSLAEGECFDGSDEARIKMVAQNFGSLELEFNKDKNNWFISSIILYLKTSQNPRFQQPTHSKLFISHDDLELFRTPLNHSFLCEAGKMKRISSTLLIRFKQLRIQPEPFEENKFKRPIYCNSSNKKVEALIIVLAIACAIVFVLIAIYGSQLCRSERAKRQYHINM